MILGLSCEKLSESEDGSDSDLSDGTKNRTVYLFRPNLTKQTNRTSGLLFKMIRSVRPLLSIILLLAFTGTLACRIVLRRPPAFAALELRSTIMVEPRPPVFNSTLLKFAAVDIGEEKSKAEIEKLLDENFSGVGRHPAWRRYHRDSIRTRSTNSLPVKTFRSPQFYGYWMDFRRSLRDWSRKKMFQPDIMFDLVSQVKHSIDRNNGFVAASDKKYGSCAVVGNSGILLNTDHGELIDRHEVVIRLNNARIERFHRNVGSKTSISFVNSNILHLCARREGCFCHPYGVNTPIVMYICQPVHIFDYLLCNASHKPALLITDPRFDTLCARIVKYYSVKLFLEQTGLSLEQWGSRHDGSLFHYSSGMQAVILAVGICERVSLFGFGKSALAKHHYHTNQKAELPLHDYAAEYAFYRDLMKNPRAIPFMPVKFRVPPVVMYH